MSPHIDLGNIPLQFTNGLKMASPNDMCPNSYLFFNCSYEAHKPIESKSVHASEYALPNGEVSKETGPKVVPIPDKTDFSLSNF